MLKNKRGFVKIIEAFVALLLIVSVVIILINTNRDDSQGISKDVYKIENSILQNIQLNDSYRDEILIETGPFPLNAPINIENLINENIPSSLNCQGRICEFDGICDLSTEPNKEVFSQSVVISSNFDSYDPKIVKLFCWRK